MPPDQVGEPSDDELIAFAAELLGGTNSLLAEPELLRDAIHQARDLWATLYRINHDADPPPP